jgi:microcystin-dependent protein
MKKRTLLLTTVTGATMLFGAAPAEAQDRYLGQIILFGNSFCPRNMVDAAGQILPIAQNTALFSLFGTTFGGNGQTTFALPDLRGRAGNGLGQGPGLDPYDLGEVAGTENVSLTILNLPIHSHAANLVGTDQTPNEDNPTGASFTALPAAIKAYNNVDAPTTNMMMMTAITSPTGGNQPMANRAPFLTLRYCVVTQGIFPARN